MQDVKGSVLIQKATCDPVVTLYAIRKYGGKAPRVYLTSALHAPSVLLLRNASRDLSDMTERPQGRSGHGGEDDNSYP
jgi:hypothetical protein